jgi:hypothetical protein
MDCFFDGQNLSIIYELYHNETLYDLKSVI